MLNNFIYAKKKSLFENALNNGLVPDEAIVFIKNTKEIWNHGTYFDGSTFDPSNIEKSIEDIIKDKADKTELPTKTSDLTNDSGFITINDVSVGNLLKTYTFYVDNIRGSIYGYTITQSELEEIQNADIVYIFINDSKKKIQLTSKTENNHISFFGYDLGSYPSTVFSIGITVVKDSDNIEVRICIDSIGLDDYISENDGTSYAAGVCYSEEFVNGALIEIVDNIDLILNSALNNFRPVILTLMDSNNDKGVILHGPYVLLSSDDMPSIKFIGEFNDLTIECVLHPEDGYLVGTLHVKSQSEGGSVDLNGYATQEWVNEQGFLKDHQDISNKQDVLVSGTNIKTINNESILGEGNLSISDTYYLELQEDISAQGIYTGTLTQELIEGIQSCKNLIIKFESNEIIFNWNLDDESYRTYSNLHVNSNLLWIVYHLFMIDFNNYSYELLTKHIYVDFDMFDVDNTVSLKTNIPFNYILNIPVNTTKGFISREEYTNAINSLFLRVQYGIHEILFIQKSAPEAYPGLYYYYSYYIFDGNSKLFITLSLRESEGLYGYSIVTESVNSSVTTSAYPTVYHGTSDPTYTLTPNTFHIWDEVTTLDLDLGEETELIANEYLFLFTSGSTATSLSLPDNIKWSDEFIIEVNKIYQISILNGLGTVMSWSI